MKLSNKRKSTFRPVTAAVSLEPAFGYLTYEDSRYQELFHQLQEAGYNPKQTYFKDRFMSICAITIDSDAAEFPDAIEKLVAALENVRIWDITKRKAAHSYKFKFDLRDTNY